MSQFCANCGAATDGVKFCATCGSPQAATTAKPVLSEAPYVPPVRKKSHTLSIVLIIVAAFVIFIGIGIVRFVNRMRDVYQDAKQEIQSVPVGTPQKTEAGCDLLDKERVGALLGAQVVATKGNEAGELTEYCSYLTAENVAAGAGDAEAALRHPKEIKSFQDFIDTVQKASAAKNNKPLLSVHVYRGNIGPIFVGLKAATRFKSGSVPNVAGPWEEAIFGPQDTTLVVRKGANGFLLDLSKVKNKREDGINLAKEMIANL